MIALASLLTGSAPPAAAQVNPSDWSGYLNGPSHSSYNAAATSITPSAVTAGNLKPAWTWSVPASPNAGSNTLQASPTVVGGVMYIGVQDGMFYAVSTSTHKTLWSDFLGLDTAKGSCGPGAQGIESTATVATDPATGKLTAYVFSADGQVYALDAATGATVWTGRVDTPSTTVNDYYSWGSPLVANGEVYIGVSSDCDNPLVPGGLMAFNQSTGAQVATWNTLPPGDNGGSIWSSVAALADGSIIATTGNSFPSTGQPLYDESIVHLDGSTLKLLDAWQVPPHQQVSDADFGASPTVFSADINGTVTPMVGACNKNGVYYAFPQNNLAGGPLWQSIIAIPYPGSFEECAAAAIWNGSTLIAAGGAPTTINGTGYLGSVQALDPATGKPVWQTGIPGFVIGSPTEDGGGVVAAQVFQADTAADMGVYLLDASNGNIIGHISTPKTWLFAQPVFAGNDLIVAGNNLVTAYEVTTPGPPITNVSPNSIALGSKTVTATLTLTGSGFTSAPKVFVSGTLVKATSVKVVSPTSLSVTFSVSAGAAPGPRDISVIESGSPPKTANSCSGCLSITAGTVTTLASTPDPSTFGQSVQLTATVSNGTSTSPTGTVNFMNGSTSVGTAPVGSGGVATLTTSTLPSGPDVIKAVYSGDGSNPGSTSNTITQAVNPVTTTTTLASSLNPATFGQTVTFTANVKVSLSGVSATGDVCFYDGTTFLAFSTVNSKGNATFTTSTLAVGTHPISAVYQGSGNTAGSPAGPLEGNGSSSNTINEVINP